MAGKPWTTVPLELPINGKTYAVQPLNHADGLDFQLLLSGSRKSSIKASASMLEVFKLCLGATWDEMEADKVPFAAMQRAGLAASDYQSALVSGLDSSAAVTIGEKSWETNLDPEALAAAVVAAAAAEKASTPSTSTGTGRKTRSPGSGQTTTSRKTTPRTGSNRKPAKAATGTPSGQQSGTVGT